MVQLYNPHKNQRIIHDSINNESYKYYVLNIGRQFGKSLLAENQCYYWAINEPKSKIAWASPIYKQAKKVFDEMVLAFVNTPVIASSNKQDLVIELFNGSMIQFFSTERYDNIRGFTFDYLICDEFAFMEEAAWTEVLRATVLVKGKKVLLISTPKGKNHFYRIHSMETVNPQYKSFSMTSYDNPIINPIEIDDARVSLPDHVFRQEYLAEFIEGGVGLFDKVNYSNQFELTTRLYAGIDIGRADDYTVLSITNENGKQVFVDRWRKDTWGNIVNKIVDVLDKYNPITMVEVNSVGDAVFEQIKNKVNNKNNLIPFVTTSKTKQDIIEIASVASQNNEMQLLDVDWLKKEFEIFTYEYNPKTRSIKYSAPNGFHDDGVIASCLSYYSMKHAKTRGVYSLA